MQDETGPAENVTGVAGPRAPPIAILFPFLQLVLAGSSLLFRFSIRLLLAMVYPLRVFWTIIHALFSPVTILAKVTLDFTLLAPFSFISMVAVGLYPIYVFCAIACIVGAAIGIFGHYVSTRILGALARTKHFIQTPSPTPAPAPSGPQAALRKRKRKSVRLQ